MRVWCRATPTSIRRPERLLSRNSCCIRNFSVVLSITFTYTLSAPIAHIEYPPIHSFTKGACKGMSRVSVVIPLIKSFFMEAMVAFICHSDFRIEFKFIHSNNSGILMKFDFILAVESVLHLIEDLFHSELLL